MAKNDSTPPPVTEDQAAGFASVFDRLVENVDQVVVGKARVIRLAFVAMFSQGHLLIEDYPGTGKTSMARAMAQSVKGSHARIQFTPDLLPGDITGVSIFDQKKGSFTFHEGPIFANIVLADEINRASPKTQSALLEVMEERRVTVDGVTHEVGEVFMVVATQNPIEQAGTYRLPEAQLDRFIMKTSLGYPDHAATVNILASRSARAVADVEPIVTAEMVTKMAALAEGIHVAPEVLDYITRLTEATRAAPEVRLGVSVRGALALTRAARVAAISVGRLFVTPDDVKDLADAVFAHRLVLDAEAEFDGVTATSVMSQILIDTPVRQA
jgi:MoxR-like ATPase